MHTPCTIQERRDLIRHSFRRIWTLVRRLIYLSVINRSHSMLDFVFNCSDIAVPEALREGTDLQGVCRGIVAAVRTGGGDREDGRRGKEDGGRPPGQATG